MARVNKKQSTAPGEGHKTGTTIEQGPDLRMARTFLAHFDGLHTLQTFNDRGGADKALTRILNGSLDDHADYLTHLNAQGAGVFFTPNEMDGRGRKLENLKRLRAVWMDLDGASLPKKWPLAPTAVIESSPGKYHVYFTFSGEMDVPTWRGVMARLVQDYDADRKCNDPVHVLRIAGFAHNKGTPVTSRLVSTRRTRYSAADIIAAFPPTMREEKAKRVEGGDKAASSGDVRSALKHLASAIVPDSKDRETYVDDRGEWVNVGIALKREYGDAGFSIWQEWSALSAKYNEADCHRTWQSFDVDARQGDDAITVRSIFKAAHGAGWRSGSTEYLDRWLGKGKDADNVIPFTPKSKQRVTTRKKVWIPEAGEHGWVEVSEVDADEPESSGVVAASALRPEAAAERETKPRPDKTARRQESQERRSMVVEDLAEMEKSIKPMEDIWQDFLPRGDMVNLIGPSKVGKSQITARLAAHVSTGAPWPYSKRPSDYEPREPASIVFLTAEDRADALIPRLRLSGADLTKIKRVYIGNTVTDADGNDYVAEGLVGLVEDAARMDQVFKEIGDVQLLIIDPVMSYLGKADSNSNAEVRAALEPMLAVAAKFDVTTVCVTHRRKGIKDAADPLDTIVGSGAFAQRARANLFAGFHGEDGKRYLKPYGGNYMPIDVPAIEYKIVGGEYQREEPDGTHTTFKMSCAEWGKPSYDIDAFDLLKSSGVKPKRENAVDRAAAWLVERLRSGKPISVKQTVAAADASGHSHSTLKRAAHEVLHVRTVEPTIKGGEHMWVLSKDAVAEWDHKQKSDGAAKGRSDVEKPF